MGRPDVTPVFRALAAWRRRGLARLDPVRAQHRTLAGLVRRAEHTRFGRDHGFAAVTGVAEFQAAVPLRRYEHFWADYWQPAFPRLVDVSWPGLVPFFAVSSGTTAGRTKYLPVTAAMRRSNLRAAFDVVAHHLGHRPQSRLFAGRTLMLGGSTALVQEAPGVHSGDLSGIAARTLPAWARGFSFPPPELALVADWEEKLARLAEASLDLPIRGLSGTPSWLLILLERVRQLRCAREGDDRPFPDLDLLIHGGVPFDGYRRRFAALLAGTGAEMREVYPASEGFIAGADLGPGQGLRLHLDHGLFFEFVPAAELDRPQPTRHWIADAEPGVDYALVLSSCAGLFAYVIGDTVRLVSRDPPRVLVTGRTAYSMSAFGEHLIGEEVERAATEAAAAIDADVTDFSMMAVFPDAGTPLGRHRWIVEFAVPPAEDAVRRFAEVLDAALCRLNDDYRAHRAGMAGPLVLAVPPGTFAAWMKRRGRLGGQNKVPRIINDAELAKDLTRFAEEAGP
jgi:hypothetical protein